jgi:hypothetical protein
MDDLDHDLLSAQLAYQSDVAKILMDHAKERAAREGIDEDMFMLLIKEYHDANYEKLKEKYKQAA